MKYKSRGTTVSLLSGGAWLELGAITEVPTMTGAEVGGSVYIGFDDDCDGILKAINAEDVTGLSISYTNGSTLTVDCSVNEILERHIHLVLCGKIKRGYEK